MANVKQHGLIQTKKEQSATTGMQQLVLRMKPQIEKALPSVLTGERFSRMLLTALSTNPQLQQCTPESFLGAMMQAAQLGVEPNTPLGQAYLIPRKNKGKLECNFQLGYFGLIDLAYRSGEIKDIQAHEVYENDQFEYELGLEPKLKHIPALKDRGAVVQYYAVFHTKNGGSGFTVMSKDDIEKYARKYSQAFGSQYSPWHTNFDSMAKKVCLKQCLKYAPLKTEFVKEVHADNTIKTSIAENMVDVEDETEYTDIEVQPVPNNVDMETGEVQDKSTEQEKADDKILEESLR